MVLLSQKTSNELDWPCSLLPSKDKAELSTDYHVSKNKTMHAETKNIEKCPISS